VARRAGLNSTYVERLERGVHEPELSQFIDLAAAVGVSPVWFLEETIAWHASNDSAVDAEWAQSRDVRISTIGLALASAVLACSDRELAVPAVVGERVVEHLAREGLTVIAIQRKPIRPPTGRI
jgi:transcriptional regulator with XRE-family HTH domain